MKLNEQALEAAFKAAPDDWNCRKSHLQVIETAIRAYLAALPSPPVSDLVERLRDRAESYRIGGPSSEHTAALLDEAATTLTALSTRNAELDREVKRLREALKAIRDKIPMDYLKRHDVSGATGPTDNLDLVAAVKDYSEDRWGLIDRITKQKSELERLREAGENLKSIVEVIKGDMVYGTWRDEKGVRIKDTPEWVSFYLTLSTSPQGGEHE